MLPEWKWQRDNWKGKVLQLNYYLNTKCKYAFNMTITLVFTECSIVSAVIVCCRLLQMWKQHCQIIFLSMTLVPIYTMFMTINSSSAWHYLKTQQANCRRHSTLVPQCSHLFHPWPIWHHNPLKDMYRNPISLLYELYFVSAHSAWFQIPMRVRIHELACKEKIKKRSGKWD